MSTNININKYTSFFHDGGIINVRQLDHEIEVSMESNQIFPEWNYDHIQLSDYETIRGILHIKNVNEILIDHHPTKFLKMLYDSGEILDFKIEENYKILLLIIWSNYPPKERCNLYQSIEIKADKIYWENIPNLFDPME